MNVDEIMHKEYCTISTDDTLSQLLGKCKTSKHFYAVIVDSKGQYVGMADKKKCLSLNIDASKMKAKHVATKAPILSPNDTVEDATNLFLTTEFHALPVLKGKKVVGMVTLLDVLDQLKTKAKGIKVDELSSKALVLIHEEDSIGTVVNWCKKKGIGRFPVVDGRNRLTGICTIEDVLYTVHLSPHTRGSRRLTESRSGGPLKESSVAELSASNLASSYLWTVAPKDTLTKAIDTMQEHNIGSIIVAEQDKPVGMITAKDILRVLMR